MNLVGRHFIEPYYGELNEPKYLFTVVENLGHGMYLINSDIDGYVEKLTTEDKETIIKEYATGVISITSLGKKYGVSKRLIQFTLFPERKELAKKNFLERQKDGRYYDKEKHTKSMQKHRAHKKDLHEKGLLGTENPN